MIAFEVDDFDTAPSPGSRRRRTRLHHGGRWKPASAGRPSSPIPDGNPVCIHKRKASTPGMIPGRNHRRRRRRRRSRPTSAWKRAHSSSPTPATGRSRSAATFTFYEVNPALAVRARAGAGVPAQHRGGHGGALRAGRPARGRARRAGRRAAGFRIERPDQWSARSLRDNVLCPITSADKNFFDDCDENF